MLPVSQWKILIATIFNDDSFLDSSVIHVAALTSGLPLLALLGALVPWFTTAATFLIIMGHDSEMKMPLLSISTAVTQGHLLLALISVAVMVALQQTQTTSGYALASAFFSYILSTAVQSAIIRSVSATHLNTFAVLRLLETTLIVILWSGALYRQLSHNALVLGATAAATSLALFQILIRHWYESRGRERLATMGLSGDTLWYGYAMLLLTFVLALKFLPSTGPLQEIRVTLWTLFGLLFFPTSMIVFLDWLARMFPYTRLTPPTPANPDEVVEDAGGATKEEELVVLCSGFLFTLIVIFFNYVPMPSLSSSLKVSLLFTTLLGYIYFALQFSSHLLHL